MARSLIHLADHETQRVFLQRVFALTLERLQIADRHCMFDSATSRHARRVSFPSGGARLADSGASVDFIIENENSKVGRIDIDESWQIVERQKHAAVGFKDNHFPIR